jgi:hypothetical protein
MAQQHPLDLRSSHREVFSDKSKLRRYRVNLGLTGRLGTVLERGAHGSQCISESRELGAQGGMQLRKILWWAHGGEMDRPLPHAARRARHDECRDG